MNVTTNGDEEVIIVSNLNGMVLEVEDGLQSDFASIVTYPKDSTRPQQKFKFKDGFIYTHSGKALDVKGSKFENGVQVIQYTHHGKSNQQWEVHSDGTIRVKGKNMCLDVFRANTSQKSEVVVWDHHGKANQTWKIIKPNEAPTAPQVPPELLSKEILTMLYSLHQQNSTVLALLHNNQQ